MNTRLQVEHGVTELVTGLDLVGLQLAVASGRPLPFAQADVGVTGHAVEVRLCAERPREDYRPTPGTVTYVRWPEGAGLRIDRAVESGSTVERGLRLAGGQAHGARRRPRCRRRPPGPRPAVARARRARDQPRPAGRRARRRRLPPRRHRRPLSRSPARPPRRADCPRPPASVTPPPPPLALLAERGGKSLVPVPAAGWRNVGTALHADELRDGAGHRARAGHRPGAAGCSVQVGGSGGEEVGTGDGDRRARGPDGRRGRPAPPLPRPLGRARRSRERARGTVDLRPATPDDEDERGGHGGRVPGPAARCRHQGAGARWATSWPRAIAWSCWRR